MSNSIHIETFILKPNQLFDADDRDLYLRRNGLSYDICWIVNPCID